MTISSTGSNAAGTFASNSFPTTTFPYITATSGRLWLAFVSVKPARNTTAPAIFGSTGGMEDGGVGTAAVDAGQTRLFTWWRTCDGTEPASDALTWSSSPSPAIMALIEFSKSNAGSWSIGYATGNDSAQSTGAGAVSATAGSDPGYQTGDLAVVAMSVPTDAGTVSNPAITIPGCTVAAASLVQGFTSNVGNDSGVRVWAAQVTAGTSTGAPSFTADSDDANASAGPLSFVRLRELASGVAPTANAGTDQTNIEPWSTVTLSGSGSDSDGSITGYGWAQTAGTTVTLSSSSVASPTFTAPAAMTSQTLTFQLTVTDNTGMTGADTVDITVLPAAHAVRVSGAWQPRRPAKRGSGAWA